MTEKNANFEELAAKYMVPVQQTPEFTADAAPADLGNAADAAEATFKLTKEQPNSDAISTPNGYYVLQLAEIIPARPLAFEEAKPKLEEQLKGERAQEALNLRATEIRNKIDAEMKAGKAFAEAAQSAGAQVEQFPAFSFMEPKMDQPDAREIMSSTADLQVGQLSEFVPTGTGGVIVHVNNRLPVDEEAFKKEQATLAQNLARGRREAVFRHWIKNRRAEANVQTARG